MPVEPLNVDVAIIGGGPAGLAAATVLKQRGVARVLVLERENFAGGIPRHCGHPPFGMREFGRIYSGPGYAAKLVARAQNLGVEILLRTNVVTMGQGPVLQITSDAGPGQIIARRVIYATGVRETSAAARMLGGQRPMGVMNTGALQSLVYEQKMRPFRRPVIVGTELVSFSAIMTCQSAGIKPVAMLEANAKTIARWPSQYFARVKRVPLYFNSRIMRINGDKTVQSVEVAMPNGQHREIPCDGVIVTGNFRPESSLIQGSPLLTDPATLGPLVDQFGRCSDPTYFASGNVLRPVETAGWSWSEGRIIGEIVADDLAGNLPVAEKYIKLCAGKGLKYIMPQQLALPTSTTKTLTIQLRADGPRKGLLVAQQDGVKIPLRSLSTRPERRISVAAQDLIALRGTGPIMLQIEPM